MFQFHKGTIKTLMVLNNQYYNNSFNSIKVRLKLYDFCLGRKLPLFQFHKGTIKTVDGAFNSVLSSVSIP